MKPSTITRGSPGPKMSIEVDNADLEALMAMAIRDIDAQILLGDLQLACKPSLRDQHRIESDKIALESWRKVALAIADVVE